MNMFEYSQLFLFFSLSILFINQCNCAGIMDHVHFAVNCGGEAHVDSHGIRYRKDYLKSGIASDYGRNSLIARVPREDMILYQTERYDLEKFSYEIDLHDDGDYVLWLKFSEVWFNGPNLKVFQVILNGEHLILDELDIFAKVGRATAHDEFIPFQIKNGRLMVKSRSSSYSGILHLTFQKIHHKDNPKVNAIIIWKGFIHQIPQFPSMDEMDDHPRLESNDEQNHEEDEELDSDPMLNERQSSGKYRKTSGPKVVDPYAEDSHSSYLPLFMGIIALIPLIFCLCRL